MAVHYVRLSRSTPMCTRVQTACPVVMAVAVLVFYVVQMRRLADTDDRLRMLSQTAMGKRSSSSSECRTYSNDEERAQESGLRRQALEHPNRVAVGPRAYAACSIDLARCCLQTLP